MKNNIVLIAISLSTAGCSSMPNLEVGYYLPKASLDITVTQTGACTDGNVPLLTTDVTMNPSYSKDISKFKTIQLKDIDGTVSNGDITFNFYDDGRLKSINSKQTGQVTNELKTLLKIATLSGVLEFDVEKTKDACTFLKGLINDPKKGFTIVHKGHTDFSSASNNMVPLDRISIDDDSYAKLSPVFGTVYAKYTIIVPNGTYTSGSNAGASVDLVEPAEAKIEVVLSRGGKTSTTETSAWVPQRGKPYQLPIQKAPWFGKNEFELVLSESNRVTKIRYSGDSGSSDALGFATEVESATKSETAKEKADRIKAEADLILQQQRLIQCQADPVNCPK